MDCKLISQKYSEKFTENILKERGINDFEHYIHPIPAYLESPFLLKDMDKLVDYIHTNLTENEKDILLIVDSDCDGYTSSAIMYNYLMSINSKLKIDYWIHSGKQHGLEDHIDKILNCNKHYDVVILPDASSNDYSYHEQLKEIGTFCLVLDHHDVEEGTKFSNNAIIVNNQLSPDYRNKFLTGAGVVYQFCRAYDEQYNLNYAEDYSDVAAVGIIGDMGSVIDLENRYIIYNGLKMLRNKFLKSLADYQSFSMKGKLNPTSVAFYMVPLINGMVRYGTLEEKTRMFLAFISGDTLVPSNKRGEKGKMVAVSQESVRECVNAKNNQNKTKEKAVEKLEGKIYENGLLDNKILFIRLEEDDNFPSTLNGLVAAQLASRFKRPTIVARLNDEGYCRGSARGLSNSALRNLKQFLNDSGFFEYNQGHPNAHGTSILNSNLAKFHEYANERLKDIDFGESCYDVNFVRLAADEDVEDIIYDLGKYDDLWGQENPQPVLYIKDINLTVDDIKVVGKNSDTLKFTKFGVTYIKFFAKEDIKEFKKYGSMQVNIIGKASINEWNGQISPQILIDNYEVKPGGDLSF